MSYCTIAASRANVTSNIRVIGCDDGDTWPLHGADAGTRGVMLAEGGLGGLFEAKIVTLERTPVRMDGAVLRAVKTTTMEVTLIVLVADRFVQTIPGQDFGVLDGEFREAFSFELDPYNPDAKLARIEWETDTSTRWIDVVLSEWQPDFEVVPHERGWWELTLKLKAYVPFWQEEPRIEVVEFTAPGSKTIRIENPGGVPMFHKWVGTRAQYRLPDNSWSGRRWDRAPGGRWPARTLLYPNLSAANGGIVVDYDPAQLPVRDAADTNLIATMPVPGDYPKHPVPPFTQEQQVTVQAVSVPSGSATLMLVMPRQFRRPWGRV